MRTVGYNNVNICTTPAWRIHFDNNFSCGFVVILSLAKSLRCPSYVNMTLQEKVTVTFHRPFMLDTIKPQCDKNNELGFTASEYSDHPQSEQSLHCPYEESEMSDRANFQADYSLHRAQTKNVYFIYIR